jgi:hypothetical protein
MPLRDVTFPLPPALTTERTAAAWLYRTIEPHVGDLHAVTVCWPGGSCGWDPSPEAGLWVENGSCARRLYGRELPLWLAAVRQALRSRSSEPGSTLPPRSP